MLWHGEQLGSLRCCSSRSRIGRLPAVFESSSTGTFGGGGGGAAPSRFSSTHLPRTGGEVRVGYEETVRTAPCVSSPPRWAPSSVTRWNCSPEIPGIP